MRHSQTAVLERDLTVSDDFETEPYEAGWAIEGRWFVQVLATSGDATIVLQTQISADGLVWCDLDDHTYTATEEGVISWPVREFGQWLRLRGQLRGSGTLGVRIYLAVKS